MRWLSFRDDGIPSGHKCSWETRKLDTWSVSDDAGCLSLLRARTCPMGEHPCRGSTQHGSRVLCPPHLAVMLISYVTHIFAGLSNHWEKLSKYSSSWTFRFWQRGPTYSKGEIMHSGDPWARTSVHNMQPLCLTNIFFLFLLYTLAIRSGGPFNLCGNPKRSGP